MGPSKKQKPPGNSHMGKVDTWSLRIIMILQLVAVIAGLIAGKTIEHGAAVTDSFLKMLELIARSV
jgi:hypothetical protein